MSNNKFDFLQFSIIQEKSAMKVGTDGVLLGAWSKPSDSILNDTSFRVLDIGTGTGLIALMIAQRYPNAVIDAVEIDHDAASEARINVANSPWCGRINILESRLNDFHPIAKYDLIVTNPPFYNSTLKPDDDARATARHADSLPFSDITRFADIHLSDNGILSVIYPTNCEENIMLGISVSTLHFHTICDVCTKVGKPCKRRMASFSKRSSVLIHEQLNLRNSNNDYSQEYRLLTSDFYLNL